MCAKGECNARALLLENEMVHSQSLNFLSRQMNCSRADKVQMMIYITAFSAFDAFFHRRPTEFFLEGKTMK
jgi:hypothetical protein